MTRRLFASYIALLLFLLTILVVPFARTVAHNERERLRTDLERDAVVLASGVEDVLTAFGRDPNSSTSSVRTLVMNYDRRTGARALVVDRTGLLVADSEPPVSGSRSFASRSEISTALAGRVAVITRYSATLGYSSLFVAVPVSSGGRVLGAVRVSFSTKDVDRRTRDQLLRVAEVAVLAMGVSAVVALALSRSVALPLKKLSAAAREFGEGRHTSRSQVTSGPKEVRLLARDFDTMASRLNELIDAQQSFIADASHQLRTPLTALRLKLDAEHCLNGPDAQVQRAAALEEVDRLTRIVDGLLMLARPDRTGPALVAIDLRSVAIERSTYWSALGDERSVAVVADAGEEVWARVDRERLVQVLDNLIANALDASASGSTLRVLCRHEGAVAKLVVCDQGPGMTVDQRAHAFDRFWRALPTATEFGGNGLGLPIARKLVEVDHGTLDLAEGPGGGVDALVAYPAATTTQ